MSIQTVADMDVEIDGDVMRIRRSPRRRRREDAASLTSIALALIAAAIFLAIAWHFRRHGVAVPFVCVGLLSAWLAAGAARVFRSGLDESATPLILDRATGEFRQSERRQGLLSDLSSITVEPATPRQRHILRIYAVASEDLLYSIPDEHAHYRRDDRPAELGAIVAEFLQIPFCDRTK